ncbi:MAG TPA: CDGSH iron-sulfur domain-containing protein [Hyphomicrobiaceae bacterium]|nr:CDGSH iron-sulfur domain-containing protein [Hyphomicrobiaceae bacterium]
MSSEPKVAQKGPYQVELQEGKAYFWCACGLSKRQPYCDGSHKGSGIEPVKFVAESTGTFNLCGCKMSDDKPFCDGQHNVL